MAQNTASTSLPDTPPKGPEPSRGRHPGACQRAEAMRQTLIWHRLTIPKKTGRTPLLKEIHTAPEGPEDVRADRRCRQRPPRPRDQETRETRQERPKKTGQEPAEPRKTKKKEPLTNAHRTIAKQKNNNNVGHGGPSTGRILPADNTAEKYQEKNKPTCFARQPRGRRTPPAGQMKWGQNSHGTPRISEGAAQKRKK